MCSKFVNPITCGFNNCWWKHKGKKDSEGDDAPKVVENQWCYADNAYYTFDEAESGVIQWRYLILMAQKEKPKN